MANDVAEKTQVGVEFTPATIKITNEQAMVEMAEAVADKYHDIVVDDDNEKAARKSQTELNKYLKALEDARKAVKKQFNEPLKSFEARVKDIEQPIIATRDEIKTGLDVLKDKRAQALHDMVDDLITNAARNHGFEPGLITVDQRWYNASYNQLQRLREIEDAANLVDQGIKVREKRAQTIKDFATQNHMDPSGWVDQIMQGADVDSVLEAMKRSWATIKHETQAKSVDQDTGEIIATTVTWKITATEEQLESLRSVMQLNRISYEEL